MVRFTLILLTVLLDLGVASAKPIVAHSASTPLDTYCAERDAAFEWRVVDRLAESTHDVLVIDLTSQTWRSTEEMDRTTWKHWLVIAIPKDCETSTAMLFIGGGSNRDDRPNSLDERVLKVALATKTVVAELRTVPNQPMRVLTSAEPDRDRYEDDLLAATWVEFLKTKDPTWLAQLPMTKSAVAAMDAVQEALAAEPGVPRVERFTVAGASKRGWTTWLTAAVDSRVAAIVPIVIDVLNIAPSMKHHHASYGFWSEALDDYERQGLADRFDDPESAAIRAIVDPYAYRERLTTPKCVINASQDEFFLADSSRFYYDGLGGEKHLSYTPNAGHGLKGSDALDTLVAFHHMVAHGVERPTVTWQSAQDSPAHTVHCSAQPIDAVIWRAVNPQSRDFRLPITGPAFKAMPLVPQPDGSYVVPVEAPGEGFSATFARFAFDVGAPTPFRISTPVWIAPDVEPFAEKD